MDKGSHIELSQKQDIKRNNCVCVCVRVSDCISTISVQYQTDALMNGTRRHMGLHIVPGYINVTDRDFLFYWFVEAKDTRSKSNANAPVILWSNGGPGCTSMEGATTEIGPLLLKGVKTGDGYSGLKLDRLVKLDQTKSDFVLVLISIDCSSFSISVIFS